MHFWSCALWRCHPRLWWFLHVGHDGDTVNKCNTEPQTAHCVWTSVRHPPLSSQCCYVKRISCWLQFLPEVAFFLHWDQTETNLCRAGKPVAVWEVRGGMASTVFSTSAATLMKRNHLTCLIGEKQVEHVAWREGEKNLIKLWSTTETRPMLPLIPLKWKYWKHSCNSLPHAACQNNFPGSLVDLIKPLHVSRTITRCYMRKSNQHCLNF